MKQRMIITTCAALAVINCAQAEPKLVRGETFVDAPAIAEALCVHNLFQSDMVLQRGKALPVWGWAAPGESVTVSFGGQIHTATADAQRAWRVTLDAMDANSAPQVMTIAGSQASLTLDNILVGDVWVLGGQSNMEFDLAKVDNGRLEIVSANFPLIRHLTVPQMNGPEYRTSFPRQYQWSDWSKRHFRQGYWDVCSPGTVGSLSAIGYVFARRIHMASQIPIGIIDASRGGTTLETWTPQSLLEGIDTPEVKQMLATWEQKVAEFDPAKDLTARIERHRERLKRLEQQGSEVADDQKRDPSDLRPGPAKDKNRPGNCYASMLAPLEGFGVKGALWHQGYNNALQPDGHVMYYQVFSRMIEAWRQAFNDPLMPFGIISLCTDGEPQDLENYLSKFTNEGIYIRNVQYQTFVDLKKAGDQNIGFASSFDQRRAWFHPQIKIPVGERIARWALATQYGMNLRWEPPVIQEMRIKDGAIHLSLDGGVGAYNDGPILGFAIAGKDGRFQPAKAGHLVIGKDGRGREQTDRKTIVLASPLVPEPLHFRYAWGRNPLANLKSGDHSDTPLATQRSDAWSITDLYEIYLGEQPAGATLERGESRALYNALQAADLARRVYEAKKLIKQVEQTED